ncbi:MAG: two-component sensor histidine kinase [Deltaproteobacteria bacterium]|nr:two-component sensor histidine kinase [Deltaproteobacteria bacterium]
MQGAPSRWIRWGPPSAALCAAAALVASLVAGYLGARRAGETLRRGQADVFLQAVRRLLAPGVGPPTTADLAAVVDAHRADGLRWVALVGPGGSVMVEAGARVESGTDRVAVPPQGVLAGDGGRVRFAAPLPPPPPRMPGLPPPGFPAGPPELAGGPPPPAFAAPPLAGRTGGPSFAPPAAPEGWLVVEFEPLLAQGLAADARRTLVVGTGAAVAFVAFALLLARALRQREALALRLERERRLATLGEMSAVLAHEIRNPLASLKGHAQLLLETLPPEGRDRAKAERVVREAVRLERLTSDLLDFVRSGEIRTEPTDPAALLRAAVEEVEGGRFEVRTDGAPALWNLDAQRVRQALVNVLRNAVQASPEAAPAEASVAMEDGRLVFLVRDRGDGVPAGEEEAIFEPFHTKRLHGTGLGLAVARSVVDRHGGTIGAANHPDGGAVFRISLPRR